MNTRRLVGTLSMAIIGSLTGAASQAAMVTYEATGTINQANNAAQSPAAFTSAAAGGTLTVDFTIDTSAAGSVNGPGDTSFLSPIVSENASVGAGIYGLGLDLNQVEIFNNSLSGGIHKSGYQLISSGNVPGNFTGTASTFELFTTATSSNPMSFYKDTSLSNAPLNPSQANNTDAMLLLFSSYVNGVFQSASDVLVGGNVSISQVSSVQAPEIDPASATSGLTLLMGGLLVLRGRRVKAG
jgi:hypothetical protein